MCGIFGYTGKGVSIAALIDGLSRLEYRGYDSCGIAAIKDSQFFLKKRAGKISQLAEDLKNEAQIKIPLAILHSRWATHGKPSHNNSHPHRDCNHEIALVHNGIIENYLKIKDDLIKKGHKFVSETDTEVVAHLIEEFSKKFSFEQAIYGAIQELEGSFALGIISRKYPEQLIGIRKGSPLILGMTKDGSFLASDIPALLPFTKEIAYLKEGELVILNKERAQLFGFNSAPLILKTETTHIKPEEAEKKGYDHFMLKEIFEQPHVLHKLFSLYVKDNVIHFPQLNFSASYLRKVKNIFITACGTAYHAGYVARYFLEKYCAMDVKLDTSSEFRYRNLHITSDDLLLVISQSGETADTLAAVKEAKKLGAKVLSICNILGSSLVKESDGIILTHAGPEIGVASTKAYTAQVFSLYLFCLYLARIRQTITLEKKKEALRELSHIPAHIEEVLKNTDKVHRIAKKFSKFGCFLFLGRGINFPSALEGALKLKEISYIPAEGYPAGEMKHGPIALIDEYRAVVCIAPQDNLYEKMISNIQEIKARKGEVLAILNHGDKEASLLSDEVVHVPKLANQDFSPLMVVVCLQLFAYYVAKNLGCDIDQPRNLAKSVTVE